jgi:hypothetical protein
LTSNTPYISVVITGRNDDYGQDFLGRLRVFLRHLDWQVRACPDLMELVIVEWNPLPDREPLSQALPATRNISVRYITVDSDTHETIGATMPVLEFAGKNVGIRRARGDFVLATNPDIVFSQAMIDWLSTRPLRTDTVYRTDRYDFVPDGISAINDAEIENYAVKHSFVVHSMEQNASVSLPVNHAGDVSSLPRGQVDLNIMHTNGAGDFILASRETFWTVRGLYESLDRRWHVDSISLYRFHWAGVKQHVVQAPCCIFHQHHQRSAQDMAYDHREILELSRRSGTTAWGLQGQDLEEIIKDPQ